jgi:membrane-bound ClpP family serine protease
VVFLGLGLLLLVLEAFAVSGGWLAAAGVISFVLGLLWFVDPTQTDITVSAAVWLPAGLTLAFVATVVTVAAARMRRLSKELRARIGGGGEWGVQGYEGRVETPVPAGGRGKAQFRGEIWTVESHQALKAGQAVKVIGVKGFTLRVEPVQSEDENK